MKRSLFIVAFFAFFVNSFAQANLQFVKEYVKLDSLYLEDVFTVCKAYYTNTGDTPLYITGYNSTCPCVEAEYGEEPLMPGDTAFVTLTFTFKHEGRFRHPVSFSYFSGDDEDPSKPVTILGFIHEKKEEEIGQ